MSIINKKTDEIIIRVVYDGATSVGKTRLLKMLDEHLPRNGRGEKMLGEVGHATEFFDWIDFSGGFVQGRSLRCEVLSTPGKKEFSDRRTKILRTADVVIFVEDTRDEGRTASELALAELKAQLCRDGDTEDIPYAMQSPELVEGQALLAFSKAVLMATTSLQQQLLHAPLAVSDGLPTAIRLKAQLLGVSSKIEGTIEQGLASKSETEVLFTPPRSFDCASDWIWPRSERRLLLTLEDWEAQKQKEPSDWAPNGAIEFHLGSEWVLHTHESWHFQSEKQGKVALSEFAAGHDTRGLRHLPRGRVYFVERATEGFLLWMVSPALVTLERDLQSNISLANSNGVASALRNIVFAANDFASHKPELFPGLSFTALQEKRVCDMRAPGLATVKNGTSEGPTIEVQELLKVYANTSERRACFRTALSMARSR